MLRPAIASLLAALSLSACATGEATVTPAGPGLAAVAACLQQLQATTSDEVFVRNSTTSGDTTTVMLTTGPSEVPWRCVAGNDGTVTEMVFAG